MKINIAIDGPSAAGKSRLAEELASRLSYVHLDTGAMYRAIGYKALLNEIDVNDEDAIVKLINESTLEMTKNGKVILDGEDITKHIRANDVSMAASNVSKHPKVREALVKMQQEICKDKGYILDGRDIGTVVLKDADIKIFLTASIESRAKRRCLQNEKAGIPYDYQEILKDIEKRDYQDIHRAASPLTKAKDAIEIDTSNMTVEEEVELIMRLALSKINR